MNANPADTVDFSTTMTASDVECVCDRATMDLMCIECKRQLHGRLYQPCDKHPQIFYMLDLKSCCCGGRLITLPPELSKSMRNDRH